MRSYKIYLIVLDSFVPVQFVDSPTAKGGLLISLNDLLESSLLSFLIQPPPRFLGNVRSRGWKTTQYSLFPGSPTCSRSHQRMALPVIPPS